MNAPIASRRSVRQSLHQYGRGVAGGLLFSLPLLYTMEVWWQGFIAHPGRLLAGLLGTFCLLLGYNRFGGLRRDATFGEVVMDSVEAQGIGLLLSAAILLLIGRVHAGLPASEIVGQIVIEAMTVAIGVSVGSAQLGTGAEDEAGMEGDDDKETPSSYEGQLMIALCGAIMFAATVGPTEEIILLAIENTPGHMVLLALASLLISAVLLHFSESQGSPQLRRDDSWGARLRETVETYAIGLLGSALMLWFFGRFDGMAPAICLSQTVVLGFAGAMGASAGRLLLQANQS